MHTVKVVKLEYHPPTMSLLSGLSAAAPRAREQKPFQHLLFFTAASLQWPWLRQPVVSMTPLIRFVSHYS